MDSERAADALKKMMRAFQSELGFSDYVEVIGAESYAALAEAADNFRMGKVSGQSVKRAPLPAEFAKEVRRVDENIKTRARAQSLPTPKAEEIFQVSPEERARVGLALEVFRKAGPNNTPRTLARKESIPTLISLAEQYGLHVPDNVRTQAKESA